MSGPAEGIGFVETTAFTRRVTSLGLEESLRSLQLELVENPLKGRLDPSTGGLRKVRMADPRRGKGKSGGARVHYLWLPQRRRVYLVFVYSKDEGAALTPEQKRRLKVVAEAIKETA